jgi:hypothetical protein
MKRVAVAGAILCGVGIWAAMAVYRDVRVGDKTPEGTIVATGRAVSPSGRTAMLDGGLVDGVILPGGNAAIKHRSGVSVFRLSDGKIVANADLPGGASLTGIAASGDGSLLAASNAESGITLWTLDGQELENPRTIKLPAAKVGGAPYPCGLAFVGPGRLAVVANRDNSLQILNTESAAVEKRIEVDPAPYSVLVDGSRAYVTCWAKTPQAGRSTEPSSGTKVEVDRRGIGTGGSVCIVDLSSGSVTARIPVPTQPTELALDGKLLYVACSNGDSVAMIDLAKNRIAGSLRLVQGPGGAPNSLSIDAKRRRLLVAYGGLDRIGAWSLKDREFLGFLRTAWYPTVVRAAGDGVFVAAAKGIGSRAGTAPNHRVADLTGTVSYDPAPRFTMNLGADPKAVSARQAAKPAPVPARLGEPSVFQHVVYVIKENRTYDQVFGDIKEGDGDPNLAIYGEEVTPNHHALAREFVLLDNYYCNGINSADGHAWTTEANATTFFERSHGGWTRSYPFGDDPLATSRTGYIWDNVLDHGKSVYNFGEFDYATPDPAQSWTQLYQAFLKGEQPKFKQNIGVARLRNLSDKDYPGWNLGIPDVLRADRFVRRLKEWDASGRMPSFTVLYLPQDHTSGAGAGAPTPRAHIADNDLAVGRAIEAISRSRFWSSTVVFVIEDDPQDGFDHVDGHRSICLVVSPYTKRGSVVSRFYNQTSVLRTIEQILALPPMNRNDATASLMTDCFQPKPDLRAFVARPNRVPLDEMNRSGKETAMRMDRPDQVDADRLNRTLWRLAGKREPYPAALAGAHGRGLAARGLTATASERGGGDSDD